MSDNDSEAGFLGRWAKRKAQVRAQENAEPIKEAAPQGELSRQQNELAQRQEEEPFDLASLPSLEDITADTDVTAFLRREVPDFLRNAALKRAWAADPGIRDYVNPAMEYAFDWNVVGGVPGSGELEAGYDAASQVAQMFSTPLKARDEEVEEGAHTLVARDSTQELPQVDDAPSQSVDVAAVSVRLSSDAEPVKSEQKQVVADSEAGAPEAAAASLPQPSFAARRRHGGATPS